MSAVIEPELLGGAGEHTLRHGSQEAVVVETGAGVRSYTVEGVDVIAGYAAGDVCPNARGQWLVPWPNRIRNGRYAFGGQEHQLPVRDPEAANAVHGFMRWIPFQCVAADESSVELAAMLPARWGYPWTLQARVAWSLDETGLRARLRVTNTGSSVAPFAAGAHPYLHLGGALVDDIRVTLGAETVLTGDAGMLVHRKPVDSSMDLRDGRLVGPERLGLYTDLLRDGTGMSRTVVDRPDGWRFTLWQDHEWPFVLLYTADNVTVEEGVRRSLAVEPMTAAVDAFNSGDGLRMLAPGETFDGTWGLSAALP